MRRAGIWGLICLLLAWGAARAEGTGLLQTDYPDDNTFVSATAYADGSRVEIRRILEIIDVESWELPLLDPPRDEMQTVAYLFPTAADIVVAPGPGIDGLASVRADFTTGTADAPRAVRAALVAENGRQYVYAAALPAEAAALYAEVLDGWFSSLSIYEETPSRAPKETPFDFVDVETVTASWYTTVEEFIEAYHPLHFSWEYLGGAGETRLKLEMASGDITLRLYDAENLLLPGDGDIGADELPMDVLGLDAWIIGVRMAAADFPIAPIRGVAVGASRQAVFDAFPGPGETETLYDISRINPQASLDWLRAPGWDFLGGRVFDLGTDLETIEYSVCTLEEPDEWREYYTLLYYIEDAHVREIRLLYEAEE